MEHRRRTVLASVGIVLIFFLIQVGTLALVEPFQQEGHQVVEDTSDPTISIVYLAAIVVVTGLMLLAFKYGGESILRLVIIFAGSYIGFYVFDVLAPEAASVTVADVPVNVLAWGGAVAIGLALYLYPEWYVIDATGIVMGIGAAGLFGINFGILPALVLLSALAVYDAISVYGTEHMLTLASGAMDMKVPVVLVMPVSRSYSFIEDGGPEHVQSDEAADDEPADDSSATEPSSLGVTDIEALGTDGIAELDDDEVEQIELSVMDELDEKLTTALRERLPDRDALFIGLGDAVIPTVLVASAAFFIDTGPEVSLGVASASLPAVTAMGGILTGLVVLLWLVLKGRAHAGLPLLNGGAIAGYLIGALLSGLSIVEALGLDSFL
ncbi:presenilin family intramembrane aspartyl protease PSH [Halovenus rubra]|uniref:Presenilin family intramembrane aspartyl protease PSH n=2 Tax=Halovenus rubra TaxID=869890 RepID=A0ACC7E1C0_9EURY|nr:presenilin family intramembrane aspartyl protease PSH [Halovenus rubra]